MKEISKTKIDQLGERLRKSPVDDEDLKLLDGYRRSFGQAYEKVINIIHEKIKLEPTGRPAKSTSSIIDKLRRETIRLSQMQDIAGCRVIVADVKKQDDVIGLFRESFSKIFVVDRRVKPQYGYRAVHVIVKHLDKLIEVQIRTELQHNWAEMSEKLSDNFDPAIKYGGGSLEIKNFLRSTSYLIKSYEKNEKIIELNTDKEMVKKEIKDLIKRYGKFVERIENDFFN